MLESKIGKVVKGASKGYDIVCQSANNRVDVGCLSHDFVNWQIHAPVDVEIDCEDHCGKLFFRIFLPILHGMVKECFGDEWIGDCRVVLCLDFLGDCFVNRSLCNAYNSVVRLHPVDAFFISHEITPSPKDVSRLHHSLGGNHNIQTLDMAPIKLSFIFVM